MAKLETALSFKQILESMRQLGEQEQRALAATVLSDPKLESFVEELDDHLSCERTSNEGPPEPFRPDELTQHEL